jgi:hypothetical protein
MRARVCVCDSVCVCARARVCVCVCARARVNSLTLCPPNEKNCAWQPGVKTKKAIATIMRIDAMVDITSALAVVQMSGRVRPQRTTVSDCAGRHEMVRLCQGPCHFKCRFTCVCVNKMIHAANRRRDVRRGGGTSHPSPVTARQGSLVTMNAAASMHQKGDYGMGCAEVTGVVQPATTTGRDCPREQCGCWLGQGAQ